MKREEAQLKSLVEGFKRVVMSGAGDVKGDCIGSYYLVERKDSPRSVTLSRTMIERHIVAARRELREPLFYFVVGGHRLWAFLE